MDQKEYRHKDDDKFHPPLNITLGVLTDKNVKQLQVLNSAIFPIKYNDQFYKDAINAPSGFVKLAFLNEVLVGAVCCRKEIYVADHAEFHNQHQDTPSTQPNGNLTSSSPASLTTPANTSNKFSLYILTLGVLAPYRERGIGKRLIEHVLELVSTSPACKEIVDIYVHVQVGNDEALQFYDRYGFHPAEKLSNYYKRIEPADCYVVRKAIAR